MIRWPGLARRSREERSGTRQAAALERFWGWWVQTGAIEVATAIADQQPDRIVGDLSGRLDDVHPGLAWELGPGTTARHVLVVTCEGDPQLRALARRWRLGAPEADELWEFADTRRPVVDPQDVTLRIDGVDLDLVRASAQARVDGAAVDVTVYHPGFADMPEPSRTRAAFLMLDTVLGEAAVETWVGAIGSAQLPPLDPVPLAGLRVVVAELQEQFTAADGEPAWAVLEGRTSDGQPVQARAQIPLRSATAPQFDTYVGVSVPFADRTPDGFPGAGSLQALRDLEEHLGRRLDGSGRLVAHQTVAGTRVLHFYVDSTTPAVEQLRAAVVGWDQGRVRLTVQADPAWDSVRHLGG
ncbi:MAG TPA: DUF695 domain-containing protein [Kineosporiaceae bacterium]|nr:DUF695 domain-containing protein [Kineosporiaceae bacterium]